MLQVLPAVYGVVVVLLAVWPVDASAASSLRRIALSAGTWCTVTELQIAGSLRGPSDCAGESHRPVRVLVGVVEWCALRTVRVRASDLAST